MQNSIKYKGLIKSITVAFNNFFVVDCQLLKRFTGYGEEERHNWNMWKMDILVFHIHSCSMALKNNEMSLKGKVKAMVSQIEILTKEEIDTIVEITIIKSFKKGDVLLKDGQIPTKCYMVLEGCIREYQIIDGDEKTTAFYTEGDKCTSYVNKGRGVSSNHYWECQEDCILTISHQEFEDQLRALIPRLDAIVTQIAIGKLNQAKEDWSHFISSSPEERYLNLLEKRPDILNRLPHHYIASYLGMKPQSLSRIRKRTLEKNKLN